MGIVENTYAELKQQELKNNPYSCLHMADIDINPHQVEAFTFALSSLELGGAILADEVGLGKTIEAGLVIKYLLCSGKNKILLIMPSNLRKQWQVELEEKFDIDSLIVDSSNWEDYLARVKSKQAVIIVSYHFASKRKTEFGKIAWDFCVFDEAHRLRNVYKNGSKMANSLYELTKGVPKILLTATPMQNTLLDIYGLVQFIDDRVFYSKQIFSERYLRGEDYNDLKACLEPVVQRTLRKEVAEYIQFSERKEMTIDFELSPMEIELYVMVNNYLKKEILYALPNSHRTLITSVIRKLLASSSMAVAETFKVLKGRLETLKETTRTESADESIDFFLSFFDDDEIETDDDSKLALEEKKPKSWCKSISAFANCFGGKLIFGVSNNSELVGLADAESDAEKISEAIKIHLNPIPEFKLSFEKDGDKTFVIVEVMKGQQTPYYYEGDGQLVAFMRIGNESVPATPSQLRELVLRGSGESYDSLKSSYDFDNMSFTKLKSVYKQRTGNTFEDTDYESFGLIDEKGNLTNAGALLADESPVRHSRLFCQI